MNTNLRTRQVDVGRIVGLNSYELAVKTGNFTGTYQQYLEKEMSTYLQMRDYADKAIADMEKKIANVTDNSANAVEVVDARDTYDTLGQRLDATDNDISIIMEKISTLMNNTMESGDIITDAKVDENGYLLITVKDVTSDHVQSVSGNRTIEMRNNGSHLQWRYKGMSMWTNLLALRDLVPKIKIGEVHTVDYAEPASATITGSVMNPTLNLWIPKSEPPKISRAWVDENGNVQIEYE